MLIRPATEADVPACDEIYRAAKEFMHSNGNPDQWNLAYPSGNDVMEGIADGTSFVCEEGGEVIATFFYRIGADPTYSITLRRTAFALRSLHSPIIRAARISSALAARALAFSFRREILTLWSHITPFPKRSARTTITAPAEKWVAAPTAR